MSTGLQLGVELGQVGADLVADAVQLVAGDAVGDLNICLPLANERPCSSLARRPSQVVELPFLARAVELEQLVLDRQRILGQVALGIGQVLVQVLDDVQRPVHPPPVAGIGADIRIDARLARGGEARASAMSRGCSSWLASRIFVRARARSCRSQAPGCVADASASMPISSSDPGCVTTKLCGIRSVFSKTISTGLPP